MNDLTRSLLLGAIPLDAMLLAGLLLTAARPRTGFESAAVRKVIRIFLLGVAWQALHFGEELATGFHERFPELMGLSPWPVEFFVAVNVAFLAIWLVAAKGVLSGYGIALFPVWFFTVAACANGLLHPLMSLRVGGYFPGLVTSPIMGGLGIWLGLQMSRLTSRPPSNGAKGGVPKWLPQR